MNGEEHLGFKLRTVKFDEGNYEHVQDILINNMIYTHVKLEHLGCYDMISTYELKIETVKKIK